MKHIRRISLWFCLPGLYLPLSLSAQQIVQGTVRSENEKTPVERVVVRLSVRGQMKAYALTNEKGEYELHLPADPGHPPVLSFEHLSYEKVEQEIVPRSQTRDVWLREKAIQIREITVSAPQIRLKGDTLSYRLSAFTGKGDVSLEDAIKKLPGMEITPAGAIQYMGKNIDRFYIEGMNMLGGKYSLATRSLPATSVSEVEIIENHQQIRQQQDRIQSEDVVVNIKLTQKAKLKPFGTSDAALGYAEEGWLYHLRFTAMVFSPRFQTISTARTGNYRPSSERELVNHSGHTGIPNKAFSLLDISSMGSSAPPVREDRYQSIQDKMISANTIHKLSENASLKLNVEYAYLRNQHAYSTQSTYYTNEGNVIVTEESHPLVKTHRPEISLDYILNDSTLYLRNHLLAKTRFDKNHLDVQKNAQRIGQYREAHQVDISNKLEVKKRIGEHFWNFSSYLQYNTSPRGRLLFSDAQAGQGESVSQTAAGHTFHTREEASFVLTTGNHSRFYFPFSLSLTYEELQTQLRQAPELAENTASGYYLQTSFAPRYEWKTSDNRFMARISAPLHQYYLNYRTASGKLQTDKNYFYADPDLYFSYRVNSAVKLNLNGGLNHALGDILDVLEQPVQLSYRTRQLRAGILTKNRKEYAALQVEYKRPLEFWFAHAGIQYTYHTYNTLSSQWVEPDYIIHSQVASPNSSQTVSSQFSITKQFQPIRTKLTVGGNYTWRKNQILQQDIRTPYYGQTYSVSGSLTSRPWSWSELNYTARASRNVNSYLNQHFSLLSQGHTGKISAFFPKGLNLYTQVEFDRREVESSRFKNITLYDAGMEYKAKTYRLQLQLNNILDVRTYSYTLFNGLDSFSYNYHLRGRELVFSVILFQ